MEEGFIVCGCFWHIGEIVRLNIKLRYIFVIK